ncbi:hypothetical protein MLD38_026791 [Melastoma candidum]|uniref:Uncharacterized protein n=1 Tax=Melastoma candidum TaxID=119954 RepID=A0ACB9NZI3_9MYRT|nr:hypothetical protein MLD38_026791 [Melastoma candidum]
MSTLPLAVSKNRNITRNGTVRGSHDLCTLAETEECDFSKLLEKPRPLSLERHTSFEEKSSSELSVGMSPRHSVWSVDIPSRVNEHFDSLYSPVKSSLATPRGDHRVEPHPSVPEAWDVLRRSMVYFRGKPVGTIAALDNSDEKLNYDQQDVEGKEFIERIVKRLHALSFHLRSYFWMDMKQLNDIYRYKTEEYSHTAVNKFNVIPDSLPDWVFDFMPTRGGYFVGNVSPARMDFWWFCLGNCIAILSSLATSEQTTSILDLIESRWEELVGEMPMKVIYPAIENHEWRILTGCDPKNTRWSYHNGGSWPVLLWLLTAACIKTGRPQIARRAIELAEARLLKDNWPEYYDGKLGWYVGKQARKLQTWSISGYLVAKMLLEDPSHVGMISLEEDRQKRPILSRSNSWTI